MIEPHEMAYEFAWDYCPVCMERYEVICRVCHPEKVQNIDWAIEVVNKKLEED